MREVPAEQSEPRTLLLSEKSDSSQKGSKKSEGTGGGEKGDAQVKSKGPRSRVSMEIKPCGRE